MMMIVVFMNVVVWW